MWLRTEVISEERLDRRLSTCCQVGWPEVKIGASHCCCCREPEPERGRVVEFCMDGAEAEGEGESAEERPKEDNTPDSSDWIVFWSIFIRSPPTYVDC